eukprot:m.169520 g.169520  ORF g.169520 m.169520 type:complete len:59 (+) comp53225_c1_seq34:131-307(+)
MQHFEARLRETPEITEAFLKMANKVLRTCPAFAFAFESDSVITGGYGIDAVRGFFFRL